MKAPVVCRKGLWWSRRLALTEPTTIAILKAPTIRMDPVVSQSRISPIVRAIPTLAIVRIMLEKLIPRNHLQAILSL